MLEPENLGAEDAFRRSTFKWALTTKAMVEAATGLNTNTRVSEAALADIEYAKELLDKLIIPMASNHRGPGREDIEPALTAEEVRETVANLAGVLADVVTAPPAPVSLPRPPRHMPDLTIPVYPRSGKMAWAAFDCPDCSAKAHQRCQYGEGVFMEKPHRGRKAIAEQA